MTAPTMQQTPMVPPRPAKSPAKDIIASVPAVPPRSVNKRVERSRSPNPDRFAQSPFSGGITSKIPTSAQFSLNAGNGGASDPIDRSGSVPMPSVGEEGMEYSAVAQELEQDHEVTSRSSSPEQTRTVGEDVKLHAPKATLPAESAKKRVMNVTRTDSDKAASFGIGKPAFLEERSVSRSGLKKKPSTSFSNTSEQAQHTDDEHGIPEFGQRVPMNPHLGDVQAPSPAPGSEGHARNHSRKHSSRGVPPGSYGMYGHGVAPQDKLEKAYYKKRPEALHREQHTPLHDRQNNFAMSSTDLNKLVRDTASRASGQAGSAEHAGTPNDEVAFEASEEYATRMATPRLASRASKDGAASTETPDHESSTQDEDKPIHVDHPKHPEYYSYGAEESQVDSVEHEYNAPILASDEVEKGPKAHQQYPAIRPRLERNDSSHDGTSRPTSRPTSIHNSHSIIEFHPLEEVREYEPLFPEDAAKKEEAKQEAPEEYKARRHFPSKDIWEDAPTSAHHTAEVSTPDMTQGESKRKSSTHHEGRPITPAQAFALHQEQLAEKEANGKKHNFLPIFEEKAAWAGHQTHLKGGKSGAVHRFPSRDVWEDTPESLLHEAELSEPPKDEIKPELPARPARKSPELLIQPPPVPERPKSRQSSGVDAAYRSQPLPEKSKPPVPARPVKKSSGDSNDGEFSKTKPLLPNRTVGGKIAALQAGFMNDLNKRLQLGPQGPKKEESDNEDTAEENDKAPLSDARKGRARRPQRRAPTKSPVPAAPAKTEEPAQPFPTLAYSLPRTIWTIAPEDGNIAVVVPNSDDSPTKEVPVVETEPEQPPPKESEETQKVEAEEEPLNAQGLQEVERAVEPQVSVPPAELGEFEEPNPQAFNAAVEVKGTAASKETKENEGPEVTNKPEVSNKPDDFKETKIHKAPEKFAEETLVANTAGESILEAKVEKREDDKAIEPVEVKDEVKP